MQNNRFDVVVIGAGLAGLTAAAVAAGQGRKVALTATGAGSFVLGAASISRRETEALASAGDLAQAIEFWSKTCAAAESAYEGTLTQSFELPTLMGSLEPFVLAPRRMAQAAHHAGEPTLIATIHGLSGFDPAFLAEQLNAQAKARGEAPCYSSAVVSLATDLGLPATTLRVANAFDRDADFCASLAAALRAVTQNVQCVLLPGILGIQATDAQHEEFEKAVGCRVGELATLPPSILGLRLYNRLIAHLRTLGVQIFEWYPVAGVQIRNGVCQSVNLASPARPLVLSADAFVLATAHGGHALLGGFGSGIDASHRPLTENGQPCAQNLFAAHAPQETTHEPRSCASQILAGWRAATVACAERGEYAAR